MNTVYPERLISALEKSLGQVYLVFGDEPYQKNTSLDLIRQRAKADGFDERHVLVADKDFDWSQLRETCQSLSLFSARKIIELELPTAKPGKEGSAELLALCEQGLDDILLVLHGPKATKDIQRAKWFKSLSQQGIYIPCFLLEDSRLFNWVKARANSVGCRLTPEATRLISNYCEGNMLAGAQEIEKLKLLFGDDKVTEKDIARVSSNHSRHSVFQMIDAMLQGDAKDLAKLLLSLENANDEPVMILWALTKEWQILTELKLHNGPINWQAMRIWGPRQQYYQAALSRLSLDDLESIGEILQKADVSFKSSVIPRPYAALSHLCLLFVFPQTKNIEWLA